MIEFMLLAAPRSGTAWASNWLTTDTTLCLHDPRESHAQLDRRRSLKRLGIACTASALSPDINAHPARKVILHRPAHEVCASMEQLRIPGGYDFTALDRVQGRHYDWKALFDDPAPIYEFLLQIPFDAERHRELTALNIQNQALIRELQHAH